MGNNGGLICGQKVEDYVPPQPDGIVLWVDSGDGSTTTTRGSYDPMETDRDDHVARAPAATGITLRNRAALAALGAAPPANVITLTAATSADQGVVRQNGRNVFAFSSDSAGMVGTWGPMGAVWSVCLFVYLEVPCDAYGVYGGAGTQRLVECLSPALAIDVPRGGSIPADACPDGAQVGTAWDVPFVQQWRQLCVVNDATSRRTYVDGCLQATAGASTFTVAANTPLTLCKGCNVWLAEFVVWSGVALTVTDMQNILTAQRRKWAAAVRPSAASIASVQTTSLSLGAPVNVLANQSAPLPSGVSMPDGCWLDASAAWTLFSDATGSTPAVPNGAVRFWKDRSGRGRHLSMSASCACTWSWQRTQRSPTDLPLATLTAGPATFATPGPLGSAFTVVAVWRLNAKTGVVGGHPCGIGTGARFGGTLWKETLGLDEGRIMPLPTDAEADVKYVHGDMVVALWERNASGQLTWRVRALVATNAGAVQWTSSSAANQVAWRDRTVQVNATGCVLALAELLVWQSALSGAAQAALQDYLRVKWGLTIGTATTITKSIPIDVNAPLTEVVYDTSVPGSLRLGTDTTLTADSAGQSVLEWWPAEEGRSAFRLRVRTGGSPLPTVVVAPDGKVAVRMPSTTSPETSFPFWQTPTTLFSNMTCDNKTVALVFATPYPLNPDVFVSTNPGIAMFAILVEFLPQITMFRYGGGDYFAFNRDLTSILMTTAKAYSATGRIVLCFTMTNGLIRYCSTTDATITSRETVCGPSTYFTAYTFSTISVLKQFPADLFEFRVYPRGYSATEITALCQELKTKWSV